MFTCIFAQNYHNITATTILLLHFLFVCMLYIVCVCLCVRFHLALICKILIRNKLHHVRTTTTTKPPPSPPSAAPPPLLPIRHMCNIHNFCFIYVYMYVRTFSLPSTKFPFEYESYEVERVAACNRVHQLLTLYYTPDIMLQTALDNIYSGCAWRYETQYSSAIKSHM